MFTSTWFLALLRLAGLVLLALLCGLMFGHTARWLAGMFAAATAWHFLRLYRLDRWLRHRNLVEPPDAGGAWGDVITQVVRLHRRKRFHKMRLLQMVREFRRSTTAMPEGVVVMNPNREILWFNRMAASLLGLRRRIDRRQRIDNLVRQPEFAAYLKRGDFRTPLVLSPDPGSERHLALHMVSYGGGQQLLLVRDVTREQQLDAIRRDFVANASHELRSPLTVLSGYLDAMNDDPALDPAWREPVAEMKRQSERMAAILDHLLELSRLEAAPRSTGGTAVDVGGLLGLLRKEALALPEHPAEVNLQLDSDARLYGSQAELHSAFQNLIINAVKYTPATGRIDIRWWTDGEGAHLSVSDTGIGIAAEHLPRLTERFYRVDPGRSRATGGSGLGLAIVKHALERHDARLEISSTEGRGSRFICHFPPQRVAPAA